MYINSTFLRTTDLDAVNDGNVSVKSSGWCNLITNTDWLTDIRWPLLTPLSSTCHQMKCNSRNLTEPTTDQTDMQFYVQHVIVNWPVTCARTAHANVHDACHCALHMLICPRIWTNYEVALCRYMHINHMSTKCIDANQLYTIEWQMKQTQAETVRMTIHW